MDDRYICAIGARKGGIMKKAAVRFFAFVGVTLAAIALTVVLSGLTTFLACGGGAPPPPPQTWGDLLSQIFLTWVAPILLTAITTLASALGAMLLKRYHLGFLNGMKDRLIRSVTVAVLAQENRAAECIKEGGDRITGADKFKAVLGQVIKAFPKVDPHEIQDLIHATVLSTPGIGPKDLVARPPEVTHELTGKLAGAASQVARPVDPGPDKAGTDKRSALDNGVDNAGQPKGLASAG